MNGFWEKEKNENGALYIDFVHQIEHKNDLQANLFRTKGNEKLAENKLHESMHCYNMSLLYSEIGSGNISLTYVDRSACFEAFNFHRQCIADVQLAIDAKCPDSMKPELEKRKKDCLSRMDTDQQTTDNFSKLSFEADQKFPDMAESIEIAYNEDFGRYVKAKRNLDVGDIILIEEPFASSRNFTYRKGCYNCGQSMTNLIPCVKCTDAMYCNSTCLESDSFHHFQCGRINDTDVSTQFKQYILRSIIIAVNIFQSIEDLMAFVEKALKDESDKVPLSILDIKSKYLAYLRLNVHLSTKNIQIISLAVPSIYRYILREPSIKDKFNTAEKERFLMHLVAQHYSISLSNDYREGENIYICIIHSYFNHSCVSNLIRFIHKNKLVCVVSRPIKKGEQLFISNVMEKETEIRRNYIYENYGINCDCELCTPDFRTIARDKALFPTMMKDMFTLQKSVPDFKIVTHDKKQLLMMKGKTIDFLRKYGHLHWNCEISVVTKYLTKSLLVESMWFSTD